LTRLPVSPSDYSTPSAPGICNFRGSMAGLCAPLPTLRRRPRGRPRTARGRCGSLLLHRDGLSPSVPCQSPGALSSYTKSRISGGGYMNRHPSRGPSARKTIQDGNGRPGDELVHGSENSKPRLNRNRPVMPPRHRPFTRSDCPGLGRLGDCRSSAKGFRVR